MAVKVVIVQVPLMVKVPVAELVKPPAPESAVTGSNTPLLV